MLTPCNIFLHSKGDAHPLHLISLHKWTRILTTKWQDIDHQVADRYSCSTVATLPSSTRNTLAIPKHAVVNSGPSPAMKPNYSTYSRNCSYC